MFVRIVGAGAVGIVVADKLSAVADTAFIINEERRERYKSGVMLNGRKLSIPCITSADASPADLLIFAVKNFSLEEAIEEARPFVGPDTIIMPLLNGIEAEDVLSAAFGEEKVVYAFISDLSSVHSGLSTTCFSEGGNIVFGERDGSTSERILKLKELFEAAGQRYTVPDDILHEKWWKFMLNTCFNTLSAIIDADYAAISSSRDFIRAVRLVAREVQMVAAAEGIKLTQPDIEEMISRVTSLRDHGKTSMLQDVDARRVTEVDAFAETVAAIAREHGFAAPVNELYLRLIRAREESFRL